MFNSYRIDMKNIPQCINVFYSVSFWFSKSYIVILYTLSILIILIFIASTGVK